MKLMIVEDDKFIIQIYHQLFKLEGIEVEAVTDGLDALDKLKSAQVLPDAVVLDVMMPKMDGMQFLAEVKKIEKLQNLPIIVFTNLLSKEVEARELGAHDFILKSSYDPKELVQKIKETLGSLPK